MKRLLTLLIVLLLATGGYFLAAQLTGGALPTFGLPLGGERAVVRQQTLKFWEDVKFRDFKSAANMLSPGARDPVAIADLLTRTFHLTPEKLDITDCSIDVVELDSAGRRARVKSSVTAHNLVTKQPVEADVMLFFHLDHGSWYLDLGSSF